MGFIRPHGTMANPRWYEAERSIDLVPVLTADKVNADHFVTLCGKFLITQGGDGVAGRLLEDLWLPWQRDALHAMYQCREAFLLMGKGSGKSVTLAAFALGYVMLSAIDGRNTRGLVLVVASSISTAKIIFDHVLSAVLGDEELRRQFKSNVQSKSLTHVTTGIVLQVMDCSMSQAVGRRPICVIADELHEVARISDSTAVLNQLRQGGANWGRAFKFISISTMPPGEAVGEFDRLLKYARGVRDGFISDPDFLPILFEFPLQQRPDLSPDSPGEWWRGMPSLRTADQPGTMDAEELEREIRNAVASEDRTTFNLIMSQRLGIPADLRADTSESVLRARWSNCPPVHGPLPTSGTITIGIDAGGVDDPLALAIVYHTPGEPRGIDVIAEQHLVRTGYDRAVPSLQKVYDEAIKNGTLTIHATTDAMEIAVIARCLVITRQNMGTTTCGGDEHGRSGFKARFEAEGGITFTSVPQNFLLGAALRSLEARLDDGVVRHNHCPLLNTNVKNLLVVETPNGNLQLKKRDDRLSGQGHAKIDGVIAAVNAVHLHDNAKASSGDITWWVG